MSITTKKEKPSFNLRASAEKEILKRIIIPALTGEIRDLKKLLDLKRIHSNDGLNAFLKSLERDIEKESGMAKLFARVGFHANKRCKEKLVTNLIYNWNIEGERRRSKYLDKGIHVPNLFVISPTMRCPLNCTGCYSGLYTKDGELSEEEIDRVLSQARDMGMFFCVVSGGEPYVLKDVWLRMFKKYDDMYFLTYTSGIFLDEETVKELAKLGNVAPALSVEGYKAETDQRRGAGVFDKVLAAMKYLRQYGVIFGTSVTYTRGNSAVVSGREFVQYFIDKGALFTWYFMFMPVGKDPILDLVPPPEMRRDVGKRIAQLRKELPIFLADFWNDGPAVGGCLAGGRSYFHILNSGRVEPCVFVHFGKDNIRDKNLIDIINSDFFRGIRCKFPYNKTGNIKRPCMIIDNPNVLREVVQTYLPEQGHSGSEDIVSDPQVRKWIDNYAKKFKKLTEDEWLMEIEDPESRWYKNGKEYRDLFRFKKEKEPTRT